ncbi:hypothetical protein soil367_13825 [Hydrocarboniclastica marina]|uniref:Uncharacterized protein n=1 Tax=Hydrocarboniclastica marina TaxID=2259620 RepID=A0A4P7XK49_9ALTE|nr:hypothetical protein soil367_13825 [Hydrocarboniclastica marina]
MLSIKAPKKILSLKTRPEEIIQPFELLPSLVIGTVGMLEQVLAVRTGADFTPGILGAVCETERRSTQR